jgi:hypothetical protein
MHPSQSESWLALMIAVLFALVFAVAFADYI